ncbi:MAG TPA: GNAT family N-acetyltransferase, partial [Actinomycetota bacterium]|nr:GNAT family N-acetyltransferase [Actinomycetota bacterium]
ADVRTRARHATVLAAVEDGEVLGTVTVELDGRIPGGHPRDPLEPDEAHVRMLGVRPDARRRGTGRRLMEAAIEAARRAGKRRLTLNTTDGMAAARKMYEGMGFRRGPDKVWDDGFRLLSYELDL